MGIIHRYPFTDIRKSLRTRTKLTRTIWKLFFLILYLTFKKFHLVKTGLISQIKDILKENDKYTTIHNSKYNLKWTQKTFECT